MLRLVAVAGPWRPLGVSLRNTDHSPAPGTGWAVCNIIKISHLVIGLWAPEGRPADSNLPFPWYTCSSQLHVASYLLPCVYINSQLVGGWSERNFQGDWLVFPYSRLIYNSALSLLNLAQVVTGGLRPTVSSFKTSLLHSLFKLSDLITLFAFQQNLDTY